MEIKQDIREILITLNEYLDKLMPAMDEMVNDFYEGNESFAFNKLTAICEGLNWVLRVLELTKSVIKLEDETDSLQEHFKAIVEALENQDYILVSDLFNYEIKDLFVSVKSTLETIVVG